MIRRAIAITCMSLILAGSAWASYRGVGVASLGKEEPGAHRSVRNHSLFGPWFMGGGFHGGK